MLASTASRLVSAKRVLVVTAVVVVELCESNLRMRETFLYPVLCDHILEIRSNDAVINDRRMEKLLMWLVASSVQAIYLGL